MTMPKPLFYLLAALEIFIAVFILTVWLPSGLSMSWVGTWEKTMMVVAALLLAAIAGVLAGRIALSAWRGEV